MLFLLAQIKVKVHDDMYEEVVVQSTASFSGCVISKLVLVWHAFAGVEVSMAH